jgi:hypothetical protein
MSDLREQLLAVRDQHGELTPALVVDAARDKKHPLHGRFEWNDKVAGERYRRQQAHQLIRVARLPLSYADHPTGPSHIRAFVAVPRGGSTQPDYQPIEDALADPFTQRLVMQAMERDIAALQRKYGHLAGFAEAITRVAKGA